MQKEKETVEDLQYRGLKLIQNDTVFRFGTDAVLLANFVDAKREDIVMEFGTGSGVIALLLAARTGAKVIGLEIQKEVAALAKRNVELNNMQGRVAIHHEDLREIDPQHFSGITAVVVNPPYEKMDTGKASLQESIRIARHEVSCTLEDIVKSAAGVLQTGGRFYMIHKCGRMAEVFAFLKQYRLEPKILRLIISRYGKKPQYMLIKAIKDARESLDVLAPLYLYEKDGSYTKELNEIYHREH